MWETVWNWRYLLRIFPFTRATVFGYFIHFSTEMHGYVALYINFSKVSVANVSLDGTVYWSKIWKEVCECRKGYRSVWETCLVSVFAISFLALVVQKSLHSSEQHLEQSMMTNYDDISAKWDYFGFCMLHATFSKWNVQWVVLKVCSFLKMKWKWIWQSFLSLVVVHIIRKWNDVQVMLKGWCPIAFKKKKKKTFHLC